MPETLNVYENLVLRYLRSRPYTVREISGWTGLNRSQVYRNLISLQYKGYAQPKPQTYPTIWSYTLGADY